MIKSGGAALVTEPGDVLSLLESPARHSFNGVHADRYADPTRPPDALFAEPAAKKGSAGRASAAQRAILDALNGPLTLDELARVTSLAPATLRAELTMLEIQRRVHREGSRIARV